jgi:hypothetical protein
MAPDPRHDFEADAAPEPTESQRARHAMLLGAGLGAILALLARGREHSR